MTLTCSNCSAPISRQSKTGRCRPCSLALTNADPAIKERQRAAARKHAARPGVRAARIARLAAHLSALSDEERQRRSAQGRHIAATVLQSEAVRARSNSKEAKAKAGAARTATVLAWCPPEYLERYRFLKNTKLLRAAEAKQAILDEVAANERRRRAAMSSLEQQLERHRNGARLIEVRPLRSAEPSYTLGGVSAGLL